MVVCPAWGMVSRVLIGEHVVTIEMEMNYPNGHEQFSEIFVNMFTYIIFSLQTKAGSETT